MRITGSHITKAFGGRPVLEEFSFVIEGGSHYLVTGPSGEGKTTLLRLILGLEQPQKGTITREGMEGTLPVFAGVVFQEDRLLEEETALENLVLTCPGVSREELSREIATLLPSEAIHRPAKKLSGGMRRRLCILRALLCGASLVVMDEPFAGLDEANRRRALAYILKRTQDKTLIITAHEADTIPSESTAGTLEERGRAHFQEIRLMKGRTTP